MKKTTIIIVVTTILLCLGFMFNALNACAEKRVVAWDSVTGEYFKLSQIVLDDTTKDITFTGDLLLAADSTYSIFSATAAALMIYSGGLDLGTNVLNDTHLGYFISWEHGSDGSKLDGEDIYDNSIDEDSLDFGTSTDQISAIDLPIADSGSLITATEVETALQEVFDKDPTITLTGDVTGTGTHTNLGNASFATTIGADKIYSSMIRADEIYDSDLNTGTGTNQINTADIPELTNLYYTEARVSANTDVTANTAKVTESTSVTAPLVLTTYDVSIPVADTTNSGYLSTTDWDTFAAKLGDGDTIDGGTW